jgi:hypothetical protein
VAQVTPDVEPAAADRCERNHGDDESLLLALLGLSTHGSTSVLEGPQLRTRSSHRPVGRRAGLPSEAPCAGGAVAGTTSPRGVLRRPLLT